MNASDLAPSEILAAHGVRDTRACIRELARHGYGFVPLEQVPDDPDTTRGAMVGEMDGAVAGVVLDVTRSLIPDEFNSSTIDVAGRELVALVIAGRVNQDDRRATTSLILSAEAAEQLVGHVLRFVEVHPGWAARFGVGGAA